MSLKEVILSMALFFFFNKLVRLGLFGIPNIIYTTPPPRSAVRDQACWDWTGEIYLFVQPRGHQDGAHSGWGDALRVPGRI